MVSGGVEEEGTWGRVGGWMDACLGLERCETDLIRSDLALWGLWDCGSWSVFFCVSVSPAVFMAGLSVSVSVLACWGMDD